jgi:hypothetical protein
MKSSGHLTEFRSHLAESSVIIIIRKNSQKNHKQPEETQKTRKKLKKNSFYSNDRALYVK